MDTRTGRSATGVRTAWLEIAGTDWLTPLADLAFGPHLSIPRLVSAFFRPADSPIKFTVPPMSEEWLERHAAGSEKHSDQS